ncbi:splicing factor SF3a60 homolog [Chenopodium quinoa]|uniref:splicing factor SF3a60 homolog n=1 Tax=Chenopodium quinoa TaxID=63459 RepID=UPI000B78D177|nr:splicing factor SF3a60 homolog [Chenopodium quinoa]
MESKRMVFEVFNEMLNTVRESSRRNPELPSKVVRDGEHYEKMLAELQSPNISFSGEQGFGRYLDLNEIYNMFINSKFGLYFTSYADYIDNFPAIDLIPAKYKASRQYKEYIESVLKYLISFLERAKPLMFLDRIFKNLESEFEESWTVDRGKKRPRTRSIDDVNEWLDEHSTVESLIELGSMKLNEALNALGLKSGGTMHRRAERLLLVKNIPLERMDRKHLKKEKGDDELDCCKEIALIEAKVNKLCEILKETLKRTRERIKNRQGMSFDELVCDREADNEIVALDIESNGEEDDKRNNNNPLKLPISSDGKPIPYWLYKLHSLHQEFNCEICGNYTYKGRRAFEKHFHEARHQHGMHWLGIPNTKSFHEITRIDDAKELWRQIQHRQESFLWQPDVEEYEDAEGNVYNKKTYRDLVRQQLI